jgi:hypothetical protein
MLIPQDLPLPALVHLTCIVAFGLAGGARMLAAQQRSGTVVIQERPVNDPRCQGRGRLVRRAEAPEDRNLNGFVCEDSAAGGTVGDDSLANPSFLPFGELFKGQRSGNTGPQPGAAAPGPSESLFGISTSRVERRDYVSCFGENVYSTATPALVIHSASAGRVISGANTRLCMTRGAIVRPDGETYVLNQSVTNGHTPSGEKGGWRTWVTVFGRDAEGDATPVRSFDVTAGRVGAATGFGVDRQGQVFIASQTAQEYGAQGSIDVFAAGADGNVPPIRTLYGQKGVRAPTAIALDPLDSLYVTNQGYAAIRVYPPGAKADTSAVRLIGGAETRLLSPVGLTLDRAQRLLVADLGAGILVFARGATGDVAPRRVINPTMRHYPLKRPRLIALDSGGSMYVRGERGAGAYAADAFGESQPLQIVDGDSAPELFAFDGLDRFYALRKDTVSVFASGSWNIRRPIRQIAVAKGVTGMAVNRWGTLYLANADSSFIVVYGPEASGNVAPVRKIAGDRTRLSKPAGLALDRADNLYVVNGPQSPVQPSVRVYAPDARGTPEPVRVIAGSRTGIEQVTDIAFDSQGDIYLADGKRVAVFDAGANGNVAPSRTLTGLRNALRLAIGRGDTLYVLDGYVPDPYIFLLRPPPPQNISINVYPPMAGGDIAPVRTLTIVQQNEGEWAAAGLYSPMDLVVDSTGAIRVSFCMPSPTDAVYEPGASGVVRPVRVEALAKVTASGMGDGCGDGFHVEGAFAARR